MSDPVAEQLVRSGRAALLETRDPSGAWRAIATVSFVEEPDGALVVAAGSAAARWATRLEADGLCRVTVAGRRFAATAWPLSGDDRAAVIRALILKYGTPSERLGAGPAFRLRPTEPAADAHLPGAEDNPRGTRDNPPGTGTANR